MPCSDVNVCHKLWKINRIQVMPRQNEIVKNSDRIPPSIPLVTQRQASFRGHQPALTLKMSSGAFKKTLVSGGTDSVSQTLPPMTERAPTTVSPPRMVAPA